MKFILAITLFSLLCTGIAKSEYIVQRHIVKKGETLSSLAEKYNTTVEQLKKWNNISKNTIQPGQSLIVNKSEAKSKKDEVPTTYIVKKGDTLSSISKNTGVPVEKIKQYNNIESSNINVGQKLVLKKQDQQSAKAKSTETIYKNQKISETYIVKKGDTLSSISKKTGVPVDEIKKLNNLKNSKISTGQKLVLKSKVDSIDTDTQQVIAITDDEKVEGSFNDSIPASETGARKIYINKYHTVKKGESLSKIAKKYHTTVASIRKLNNLKSSTIQPGRTIIVARIVTEIPEPVINPKPIIDTSRKIYYNVKLGDTLESIAAKFGISVSALKESNLLFDGKIKIGQTLVIPHVANSNESTGIETSLSEQNQNDNSKLLASKIIECALNFINTPYRYGGLSKKGIDCSGLAKKSYEAAGLSLPRTSREQAKKGEIVPLSAMKPGDLIFFGNKGRINHVGIYIGDNKFIHASKSTGKVVIANLDDEYYQKHLICIRTLVNDQEGYLIEEETN